MQPKSIIANNNVLNYGFAGSAISGTNSLTKLGAGALTIYNANTYSGGTILSAGTLNLDNNAALGTGVFTISGGTIDDNGSGPVTLANNVQNWNGDFTYVGSQTLNLGTGAVLLGTNRQVTVSANTLTVGGVISDGGIRVQPDQVGRGRIDAGQRQHFQRRHHAGSRNVEHQ